MKTSKHGVEFIAQYEGFAPFVYDDKVAPMREWKGEPVRGTLTIGYGHTNAAKHPLKCTLGTRITKQQALDILAVDLAAVEGEVNNMVKVPITQGQYDACISFTYNCGGGNFAKIAARLNKRDYKGAKAALGYYVTSKGQVMNGLVRRRRDEQKMWDEVYTTPTVPTVAVPKTTDVKDTQTGKAVAGAGLFAGLVAVLSSKPAMALEIMAAVVVVSCIVGYVVHRIKNRKVDGYVPEDKREIKLGAPVVVWPSDEPTSKN